MGSDGPSDAELLAAGGWADVAGACVLAKSWDGDFCAAVLNTPDVCVNRAPGAVHAHTHRGA